MATKKRELNPLIPLDDLKSVVARLIAIPKPKVEKSRPKPKRKRKKNEHA